MSDSIQGRVDWLRLSLSEITEFHPGFAFPDVEQGQCDESLPFYKVGDMSRPENGRVLTVAGNYVSELVARRYGWKSCPPGSVAFAKVGAALLMNRRRIIDRKSIIDNNMLAVSGRHEVQDSYLYYLLQTVDFSKFVQDGVVPSVNQSQIGNVKVLIPPLPQQRRITGILDTADELILATERLVAKLEKAKQGLLHDLLTRAVDRPSKVKPLGDMSIIAGGVTLGRSVSDSGTIELPYLRVANVQDGFIDTSEMKTVRILRTELERYQLRAGDVLMTEGGDFDKLGRGAVWDGSIDPCLHQNHIFRVRCNRSMLLPQFLAMYSASPAGRRHFVLISKQTTNLASINMTQLKAFPVPIPPLQEQSRIVTVAEAQDNEIKMQLAALHKLRLLKRGLMEDLLAGRVQVGALA